MKASDALELGALITNPEPFRLSGCALGMMANAMNMPLEGDERRKAMNKEWPWLLGPNRFLEQHGVELAEKVVHAGAGTLWAERQIAASSPWSWIATVYNIEVYPGHMTLEALAKIIRTMEPACGECNSFGCHCGDLFSHIPALEPPLVSRVSQEGEAVHPSLAAVSSSH